MPGEGGGLVAAIVAVGSTGLIVYVTVTGEIRASLACASSGGETMAVTTNDNKNSRPIKRAILCRFAITPYNLLNHNLYTP
jgi:hypothetical protein